MIGVTGELLKRLLLQGLLIHGAFCKRIRIYALVATVNVDLLFKITIHEESSVWCLR